MKSREEFVRRWRNHLAGLALFGLASDAKDGTLARAAHVLDIPAEVERLLAQMYADLAGDEVARLNGKASANGHDAHDWVPPVEY